MDIERGLVVEMLFDRGELEKAERAETALPERFDPLVEAETLKAIGLDPGLLATQSDELEP